MENQKSTEMFRDMPVAKAVLSNAIPAMVAMLMVLVYNLADTFFIGQTHDALQVAAVSISTPVFLLFMSVGSVFGIGGTSVISRALGEGRPEYAKKVCSFCMWSCIGIGVLLAALMLSNMNLVLSLAGASEDTWEHAKNYLSIVALCGPCVMISNCCSNVIRAEGEANKAMVGQLIGNILNIILDPIMILVLGWDIVGAAVATVIGNVFSAAYYILFYVRGKSSLSISIRDFSVKDRICSSVLAIGVPASLGSLLMSVSQIICFGRLAGYGDMVVAALGVANKVTTITGLLFIGLGGGVQPLLGYCVGARLWPRFKQCLRFSLIFAFCLSAFLTGLCYLFTKQIVGAFLTDPTAFDYGVKFARIHLATSGLFGLFFVLINALQAMGAALESLLINLSRQGIIFIPLMFILEALFGLTGIIWTQPFADVLSLVLAAILCFANYRKMMASHPADEPSLPAEGSV